ncbi:MAG: hypothetical protein WKG52_11430, partial [Variovorax sp.]
MAGENGAFTLAAASVVKYGANDTYATRTMSGTVKCDNATFGGDPAPFIAKECYVQVGAPVSGEEVMLGVEGANFSVASATQVRYGADTRWATKTVSGSGSCTNGFFGSDPAPFTAKRCFGQSGGTTAPGADTRLASEGGSFSLAGATEVRYGA